MSSELRPIYVIDTNVLVDYPDIIPGDGPRPEQSTVDLANAHLIIPSAVVRELSSFKKEKSDRGKAARIVLKRLRELAESDLRLMDEVYHLDSQIEIGVHGMSISILPVHKNFKKCLPFAPSEDDMDGQIILATLVATALYYNLPIDGTADTSDFALLVPPPELILLTNDNGLAIRARERGIRTNRYGYKYPEPYTGRRDIVVTKELFHEFYKIGRVDRKMFEAAMPEEQKLVANEFIIMSLADENDYPNDFLFGTNPYYSHIGRYDRDEDAIVPLRYLQDFPCRIENDGQAIYAEALMNPDIAVVICTGPAGSGKTYMSTIYSYDACKRGEFIGVTVVPCESHNRLGALPGDLDDKMDLYVQPQKNALRNDFLRGKLRKEIENQKKYGTNNGSDKRSVKAKVEDLTELEWSNWFSSVPIENARGRDFSHEIAIYDEFQDQNISQADTLIKRIGLDGKIILTGDIHQIHAAYLDETNNGLTYASRILYDDPMVAQVCFTEDEVVRHPIVKLIAKRQKAGLCP